MLKLKIGYFKYHLMKKGISYKMLTKTTSSSKEELNQDKDWEKMQHNKILEYMKARTLNMTLITQKYCLKQE